MKNANIKPNYTGTFLTWFLTGLNSAIGYLTMTTQPNLAIFFFIMAFLSLILFLTCVLGDN